MRDRLMVGRRTLDPLILVRFQVPQQAWTPLCDRVLYLAYCCFLNPLFFNQTLGPRKHPRNLDTEATVFYAKVVVDNADSNEMFI